jgi:hypothetical protein
MGSDKNSSSGIAASPAMRPQTPHALAIRLLFRTVGLSRDARGVSLALLQSIISRLASLSPEFLIASPELEFPASPTKQTTGPQSNRKKIAIFSRATMPCILSSRSVDPPRVTGHKSRTTELLIATFNISRIRITSADATLTYFLTATKQRFRQIPELRALACLQSASVIISNSVES